MRVAFYKPLGLHVFFALALAAVISFSLEAQVVTPVKWRAKHNAGTETKVGDVVELSFEAEIEKGWYLYSSDFDPNLGPLVTTFKFTKNSSYELVGKITPVNPKKKFDEMWGGDYTYFTKKGEFKQKVKVLQPSVKISASVECQTCTEEDGRCVPNDDEFTIEFRAKEAAGAESKEGNTTVVDTESGNTKSTETEGSLSNSDTTQNTGKSSETLESADAKARNEELLKSVSGSEEMSILGFMLVAFLSGLAALLTPCVFPMIPMTVSFFTTRSGTRAQAIFQAALYGVSIITIYTLIGVFVSYFFGEDAANFIATNWAVNTVFFLVFLIFAISFFGAFEIVLPSSFVNAIDRKADTSGGYLGIFFMALTLVVVSFSCTGPIAGTILVESARGNFLKPAAGMFAFSAAFALPFTLFAMFPSWLSKLPSSGGWLNTVKVVLGFIELALAFKFLSVADQVEHWGILDRDIYLAIWIAIALAMTFYLWGLYKLPHDSHVEKIGVGRFMTSMLSFIFAIYLIPGLFGAPLKALSGYLPPMSTHNFDIMQLIYNQNAGGNMSASRAKRKVKYGDFLHLPHNIDGFFDYNEALAAAKSENKPLFIDFTGHGCVNCREMEAYVWSDPEVLALLKEKFVVVALYVDDPTELPESEWVKSSYDGKLKKTIGKINADIQKTRFNNNAQPYYVTLDTEGNMLVPPTAYNRDVRQFYDFLNNALKEFERRKK
jgi:thiol:disulfide interchange protein DsbD